MVDEASDRLQKWSELKMSKDVNCNKLERQDGVMAGVCGGLGAFFGLNPIWFRILFLILLLPGGLPGLLPYILLWIIIPKAKPVYADPIKTSN
jgi:phage shock protein C